MPVDGPWITPPPVSDSGPLPIQASLMHRRESQSLTSFAAACEGDTILPNGNGDDLYLGDGVPALSEPYIVSQVTMAVSIDDVVAFLNDAPPPTLPPGATGYEYDPADPPSLDWLTGNVTLTLVLARPAIGVDAVDNADWPITARLIDPATYTATDPAWPYPAGSLPPTPPVLPQPPDQLLPFYPGATLAGLPAGAHWTPPHVGTGGAPYPYEFDAPITLPLAAFADVAGRRWTAFVLHFDGQVTHVHPTTYHVNVSVANTTTPGTVEFYDGLLSSVAFTYQPRRYRFVYGAVPPLRQRQRPTGIGAAAGPPLRQRTTLGDVHPPLRQRGAL